MVMPASPLNQYPQIAVVAHDAGGAEIVSGHIKRAGLHLKCRYSLQGPAVEIFSNKLGPINNEDVLEILPQCDCLFSATSWDSTHEYAAIKLAKALGIKTIVFLDHWVNYGQRFIRGGEEVLPEEVWISDMYGLEMARHAFGSKVSNIRMVENPYLIEANYLINQAARKITISPRIEVGHNALFLSEAISEHALKIYGDEYHWGYTQLDALKYLIKNINSLRFNIQAIRIRPHPSEDREKYLTILNMYPIKIELSAGSSLWDDIAWSNIVLGCNSMAMAASLGTKRRVVSVIPPQGGVCKLPHTEIESLASIVEKSGA